MTPISKHRLSPSGIFLGDPGLQAGPGTIGLIWRQHGTTSAIAIPSADPLAIPGLGGTAVFAVNMQPGYLYELQCAVDVHQASTATVARGFHTDYRLRNAPTSAWGSWLPITDGGNHLVGAQTTVPTGDTMTHDARFGVSVIATCNAIEFGVQAEATADLWITLIGEHCYAKVIEYMP